METANGSFGIYGPFSEYHLESVFPVSLSVAAKIPNLVGSQTSKSQKTISCGIGLSPVYEPHWLLGNTKRGRRQG